MASSSTRAGIAVTGMPAFSSKVRRMPEPEAKITARGMGFALCVSGVDKLVLFWLANWLKPKTFGQKGEIFRLLSSTSTLLTGFSTCA
jgi:hypothetical protein